MASEFCQEYLSICRERNIEPNDGLLKSLERPCASPSVNGRSILNLRTTQLDEQTCGVLGKLLSVDRLFEHIDLGDCTLSDGGVTHIICGLNTNTVCKKLNLKGNNIRGKAVECLGRMLRQNKAIESLSLDWNKVGMLDESFMVLCEGVGGNASLTMLDLRNNEISHRGAAELSTALKRNITLRSLDLRWNNIGLVGGRSLLEAFKFNRTLDRVDLNGNDIPAELKKAIENAARNNEQVHMLSDEYKSRTQTLARELSKTKQDSALQFDDLMCKLDEKDERLRKTNRFATQKVERFQELLDERKSAFNTVSSRLARVESELLLSEQKGKDLEILLEKERSDKEALTASYRTELRAAQQQHAILENRLSSQLADVNEKHNDAIIEVTELKRKCESQTQSINELKETVANLEADSRVAAVSHQERLKKEQLKYSQLIREAAQQKDKEVEQVRNDQSVIEKSLRDHIAKVETQKRDCEEEISKLKALMISERMKAEEELSQTRQKLKSDQDFHVHHMEDKLKLIHSAKDEVQQMNSQQACVISELQTKNNSLSMNVDNLKRQIESLQQGIASKHHDIEKAKQEVQERMNEKLKDTDKESQRLKSEKEKLAKAERRLEDQVSRLELAADKKSEELKHLKEKLSMRESDIAWMRQETAQRAQALQTAVRNYAQPLTSASSS